MTSSAFNYSENITQKNLRETLIDELFLQSQKTHEEIVQIFSDKSVQNLERKILNEYRRDKPNLELADAFKNRILQYL